MAYANPSGTNGPRNARSTGRLRNALTNLRTKQHVYPGELVRRAPVPPKPSGGGGSTTLPKPSEAEVPDLKAAVERLKNLTAVQVPKPTPPPAPPVAMTLPTMAPPTLGVGATNLQGGSPQANMALGKSLLASVYNMSGRQWQALKELWTRESGWRTNAVNDASGAAGIPQALPSAHPGLVTNAWMSDPRAQILWGLRYIMQRYGDPVAALAHSDRYHWY